MYVEFLDDPKILSLAFEDQRHFIGILALKCGGILDNDCAVELLDKIVAQRLWVDRTAILEVKKRLIDARLIDKKWQPLAWNKRQFISDIDPSASERKRRQRAKNKEESNINNDVTHNVTDLSRVTSTVTTSNVTRTDTDTDTEQKQITETEERRREKNAHAREISPPPPSQKKSPSPALAKAEQKSEQATSGFTEFIRIYPGAIIRRHEAYLEWQAQGCELIADLIIAHVTHAKEHDVMWQDGVFPNPHAFIKGRRWEDEIQTQRKEFKKHEPDYLKLPF
jgi:hypothetical protein